MDQTAILCTIGVFGAVSVATARALMTGALLVPGRLWDGRPDRAAALVR